MERSVTGPRRNLITTHSKCGSTNRPVLINDAIYSPKGAYSHELFTFQAKLRSSLAIEICLQNVPNLKADFSLEFGSISTVESL